MRAGDAEVRICGETLVATTAGALYWPSFGALIVADLHFEKGSSFAHRGVMLPPYDTRTTLRRLHVLCEHLDPAMVVSLGDAFHEEGADERMDAEDAALLDLLMKKRRWIWVLGNHDPKASRRFAGEAHEEMRLGALAFRHEPQQAGGEGELAGHLHPCAKVRTEGGAQRRRCFAGDGRRLILPAFGAYAGGLNVLDEAFDGFFRDLTAWVMGADGVYPIARGRLAPDDRRPNRRAAG